MSAPLKRALGVCYYPEHWPEDMWAKDAARMVSAGITWVRIGEFAWSRMEPEPGRFTFDWLDRAIDVLASAGLKIVLGTPTCTPPRWMLDRFPDMLAVDALGRTRNFGSRRHYCFSHAGYRKASAAIADVLGRRYGQDPHIHAWQLDNEYGCHDTVLSYSEAARLAFQDWLATRYGTIDALNTAWGNVFWSMEYESFAQVDLPNLTVTEPNPSHALAFRRFSSDQVVAYHMAQVDALRAHTDAPLIHNYMGRVLDFDHFEVGRSIEIASWDSYPIGFLSDRLEATPAHKSRYLQQGDPDMQAFHHDLYRAVGKNGRWWVMEQQPGPVNWAPHNPAPLPGMVRLWTWEAFAHGAEVVSYFRWRQAPFAQEQMHSGLLRPDDAAAPGLAEAEAVATEISAMPEVSVQQAQVALIFDYPSEWAWATLPQGAGFTYFGLMLDAYRALRKRGLSVDILPSTTSDLSGYRLVLVPGLATLPDSLRHALGQTTALVGPRSNCVTEELTIPTPMGPGLPGLDVTVTRVESLSPGAHRTVPGIGVMQHWVETLEGSAQVTLQDADGAALVVSSGALSYLGGWPDAALWDHLIADAAARCGIETRQMPEGLRCRETKTHRFYFNYGDAPCEFDGLTLPAAGVAWVAI
ncbi:beta-galactosidase [Roseobacter litoralis]|uniref:Beta-galactosidase n=1 Tax=Roseobacter litoralis (strain ATCC 49566 / DSM 6996 / JCM 21268 / NBRC 15278 / OCh 149) TaxID=391595 RepID=F7ZG26_ROSLO|nr:beta-galactosidase [Roseobacter litoralis]AEI93566.1 beta-galactosidase 1 [Roseobacter litoralis Och 149]